MNLRQKRKHTRTEYIGGKLKIKLQNINFTDGNKIYSVQEKKVNFFLGENVHSNYSKSVTSE